MLTVEQRIAVLERTARRELFARQEVAESLNRAVVDIYAKIDLIISTQAKVIAIIDAHQNSIDSLTATVLNIAALAQAQSKVDMAQTEARLVDAIGSHIIRDTGTPDIRYGSLRTDI